MVGFLSWFPIFIYINFIVCIILVVFTKNIVDKNLLAKGNLVISLLGLLLMLLIGIYLITGIASCRWLITNLFTYYNLIKQ
jgi:hypothetical protein